MEITLSHAESRFSTFLHYFEDAFRCLKPGSACDQVIVDSQHLVENWGDGAASWWYYAPWYRNPREAISAFLEERQKVGHE